MREWYSSASLCDSSHLAAPCNKLCVLFTCQHSIHQLGSSWWFPLGFCLQRWHRRRVYQELSHRKPVSYAVPMICLTVPANVLESDFGWISVAIFLIWARVKLPVCLSKRMMSEVEVRCVRIFSFFLVLAGSLSSLMTSAGAVGWILTVAARFWQCNSTITLTFLYLAVSLMISSPTFLAFYEHRQQILEVNIFSTRPSGPSFGARVDAGPASPPQHLKVTKEHVIAQKRAYLTDLQLANIDFWWHGFFSFGNLKINFMIQIHVQYDSCRISYK